MIGALERVVHQSPKNKRWYWVCKAGGQNVTRCRVRGFATEAEADQTCKRYSNLPPFLSLSVWVALAVVAGAAFALGGLIL